MKAKKGKAKTSLKLGKCQNSKSSINILKMKEKVKESDLVITSDRLSVKKRTTQKAKSEFDKSLDDLRERTFRDNSKNKSRKSLVVNLSTPTFQYQGHRNQERDLLQSLEEFEETVKTNSSAEKGNSELPSNRFKLLEPSDENPVAVPKSANFIYCSKKELMFIT